MKEGHEKLIRTAVYLEEEMIEELAAAAENYSRKTGRRWTRGAVIRLAVSDFFAKLGKIV